MGRNSGGSSNNNTSGGGGGRNRNTNPKTTTTTARAAAIPGHLNSTITSIRVVLLAIIAGYYVQKTFQLGDLLLPNGIAVHVPKDERIQYTSIDYDNDSLQLKHGNTQRIYESMNIDNIANKATSLMNGPETIVFSPTMNIMYSLTEDGKFISITNIKAHQHQQESGGNDNDRGDSTSAAVLTADVTFVKDLGPGRPLGGKLVTASSSAGGGEDGDMVAETLYVADAHLGLTRVQNIHDPTSKVEIVASEVLDERTGRMTQILYADDVAIGPKTGNVYFTDACNVASDRIGTTSWDTLYASKVDLMRGKGTGRLLMYNPKTDVISILVHDLRFPNGIAVDKDETYIFFAETFGIRLYKYHLVGDKMGTLEVVMHSKDMVGYVDGVDCNWDSGDDDGLCYAAVISAIVPLQKLWSSLPEYIAVHVRNIFMMVPKKLAPPVAKYGGIIEINPITGVYRYIQDPVGQDIAMITGVTVHNNIIYLGSLTNQYIGTYKLRK